MGLDDQDNEVVDEADVTEYPEDELLIVDTVEDGVVMVDVAKSNVDAKDVLDDIPMQG